MSPRPISTRALTWSYTVALLMIAGLSIGSHFLLEHGLHGNRGSAAIVNIAGRQRMLSQRIAGLAAQYQLGDASVAGDLRSAIATFETDNAYLIAASQGGAIDPAATRGLHDIYFGGAHPLDPEVHRFTADARLILARPPGDPTSPPILARLFAEARSPLLTALDQVVTIHQRESERQLSALVSLQWAILATVILTLTAEAVWIFRPLIRRVVSYTSELLHLASIDTLTGTLNRRSFIEKSEIEIDKMRRSRRPVSLMMLDADRFKAINDTWGHGAGDEVLRAMGAAMRESLRQTDICGRLGGEEFAVLLTETPLEMATVLAERLREQFAATTVMQDDNRIRFTVSIGVASVDPEPGGLDRALRAADALMYRAKQQGRNQVISA